MIIKKFQAKTKEDALVLAKKELGEGIVEMNVRNVRPGWLKRLIIGQRVEVTVALEEENERYGSFNKSASQPVNGRNASGTASMGKIISMTESSHEKNDISSSASEIAGGKTVSSDEKGIPMGGKAMSLEEKRENTITEMLKQKKPDLFDDTIPGRQKSAPVVMDVPKGKVLEEKLDNLQSLLEQQLQKKDDSKQEVKEEKEEKAETENSKRAVFLKLLHAKMIDNELDEKYASEIIQEIDKGNKPDVAMDYLLADAYQRMILKFGKPSCIAPATNGPKVVFFIGPTGVGKTTTIAKIASAFRVDQHKKVALLTADTYRIAAAEQLRTYANILEVPFRVVYTPQEVEYAVRDFYDFDYILVDTTGHSQNNEAQKENMNDFLKSISNVEEREVYLVLSASTKYRDLKNIVDTYHEITDYKLIFTKLDETLTLGNLFNLKLYANVPMSYVTCGQNVPDDIEDFNPQKTVKQLLGGKN